MARPARSATWRIEPSAIGRQARLPSTWTTPSRIRRRLTQSLEPGFQIRFAPTAMTAGRPDRTRRGRFLRWLSIFCRIAPALFVPRRSNGRCAPQTADIRARRVPSAPSAASTQVSPSSRHCCRHLRRSIASIGTVVLRPPRTKRRRTPSPNRSRTKTSGPQVHGHASATRLWSDQLG
jgi:hypothetical protein